MRSKTKLRTAPAAFTPTPEHPALAALKRSRWLYAVISLLLLLPCYWQEHIEAGDLSSHIYNTWLAHLIAAGQLPGLRIATQTTNVLFDLMLSGLFSLAGPDWAQRIPVSLSVLIFTWGAFAFARAVSGRMPWQILPCIAILAYGWVFHMGFFNFYLSLGLCFWALALLWEPNARRVAVAAVILALAYVAHGLPVAWVAGLAAYAIIARRLPGKSRLLLTACAVAALVAVRVVLAARWHTIWGANQLSMTTGLDQAWVFDSKYYAVLVALLFLWVVMFLNVARTAGAREVFAGVPFQLCLIGAAAVFILPNAILIPGYKHALAFIAQRMSLGVGICVCALLASAAPRRFERGALIAVAVVFFAFLFHDEHAINAFENRMQRMVAALPPGQRVISAIDDHTLRIDLAHVIDRACLGHCYSYANYEPSTAQFRVRAEAPNPYVAYTYADSWLMQNGQYVVKQSDLPLYQVDLTAAGEMVMKTVPAGVRCGSTEWKVLGDLL
jgi:hypothetical protein